MSGHAKPHIKADDRPDHSLDHQGCTAMGGWSVLHRVHVANACIEVSLWIVCLYC